jgi:GNAT superfamily N-acetyltransferase
MTIDIRPLKPGDPPVISAAFQAMGWSKSVDQYERYLDDQAKGEREVFVAWIAGEFAGYVTLLWRSPRGIPEIQDLNVVLQFRRRRVGTELLNAAEKLAASRAVEVAIGVGLHPGYNAAQRMYVLRGYVPDGHGVTYRGLTVEEGQVVAMDDHLVLHLRKALAC